MLDNTHLLQPAGESRNVAGGSPGQARVVLDGLRPDAMHPRHTPTRFRLRQEGVDSRNSHLERFGPAPAKGGPSDPYQAAVDWTEDVLREFVLPELRPDVVITWLTEPDHMQHAFGAGSPSAPNCPVELMC